MSTDMLAIDANKGVALIVLGALALLFAVEKGFRGIKVRM